MEKEITILYSVTIDHYFEPWEDCKTIVSRSKDPFEIYSFYEQSKEKYKGTNARIIVKKEISTTVKDEITPKQLERIAGQNFVSEQQ